SARPSNSTSSANATKRPTFAIRCGSIVSYAAIRRRIEILFPIHGQSDATSRRMTAVEITKPKRYRSRKYSAEPVALMPDLEALGPAMLALNERQRRFVLEYVNGPSLGYGAATRAARAAGYKDGAVRVTACQLLHHPKIQSALHEIGGRRIRAAAFA